ncbi:MULTISPECIES: hypothetical protein [unclassified Kribbella]|jgi:hypothetical protein|uniref:hypothetical protein n=1 Tax=unclassified Kribbella TaxID=2644121 RepID=UPI0033C402EA|nr:hypothetical protein OG817_30285 [Kribbella sp. NBC_00889]
MMMFNPNNPTVMFMRVLIAARIQRARRLEGGASALEWVLISALLIGVALAVGKIILDKLTKKADSLDLG